MGTGARSAGEQCAASEPQADGRFEGAAEDPSVPPFMAKPHLSSSKSDHSLEKPAAHGRFLHWAYAFMSGPVALAALSLGVRTESAACALNRPLPASI